MIVPSKATRDELIRLLDADPTRIDVAYHGVDQARSTRPTEDEKARVRARLGLPASPTSRSSAPRSRARTCPT